MGKIYKRLYRTIIKHILSRTEEKRILIPFTFSLKMRYYSGDFKGLAQEISSIYNPGAFDIELPMYLLSSEGDIIRIQSHAQAIELYEEGIISPVALIRYWPTVPPHFSRDDIELAEKAQLEALATFTREGNIAHIFMAKGDWEELLEKRRKVAYKLIGLARTVSLIMERKSSDMHEPRAMEPDELKVGDNIIKIFPHIDEDRAWKEAINELIFSYISREVPQYFYLRLVY